MRSLLRPLVLELLPLSLLGGCVLGGHTYPPALPADSPTPRWSNHEPFIPRTPPPPELAYQPRPPETRTPARLIPTASEWSLWEPAPTAREVCRGTGKARRCAPVASPTVSQAQASALIRPMQRHLGNGQSATVTYDYQPGAIYLVEVAPYAGTHLLLPPGERLRIPPVLNKEMFVVGTDDTPEEDTVNDILAVRAKQAPQRPVNVPLIFRSGLVITVRLVTIEGDPMTLVQWRVPERAPTALDLPIDARPPKFDDGRAYLGYTLAVEGHDKLTPPWMPVAIADDGSNTLIKFARPLDWTRAPVVVGLAQNGKPSITPNRYFTRPAAPEEGAWLFVQGLWPALQLKDSAGLTVKIVRTPPAAAAGEQHAAR